MHENSVLIKFCAAVAGNDWLGTAGAFDATAASCDGAFAIPGGVPRVFGMPALRVAVLLGNGGGADGAVAAAATSSSAATFTSIFDTACSSFPLRKPPNNALFVLYFVAAVSVLLGNEGGSAGGPADDGAFALPGNGGGADGPENEAASLADMFAAAGSACVLANCARSSCSAA